MLGKSDIEKPHDNPILFKDEPELINKLIVRGQYVKKLDQNQVVRAGELKNQAIALIGIVKREYKMK